MSKIPILCALKDIVIVLYSAHLCNKPLKCFAGILNAVIKTFWKGFDSGSVLIDNQSLNNK